MGAFFETGLATALDIGITLDHLGGSLPEYLYEWPILSNKSDYDAFVAELGMCEIHRALVKAFKSLDMGTGRYSDGFRDRLKGKLGE